MTEVKMSWVDMETTGLDANLDVPLELGIVLTDEFGMVIAERAWLVHEGLSLSFQESLDRGKANKFIDEMHTKSGLWDDLKTKSAFSRAIVDELAVDFLKENHVKPRTLPMAGSSVGSLDRPFALRHFPKLNEYLHYRNIDISSIKEVCRLRNPLLLERIQEAYCENSGESTHRVLDDCMDSINEYLAYCDEFLMVDSLDMED